MSIEHGGQNKGQLYRQLSDTMRELGLSENHFVKGIKASDVRQIMLLMDEIGPEGKKIVQKIVSKNIDPDQVMNNLKPLIDGLYRDMHPIPAPVTTRSEKKFMGIFPGTVSVKTVYDDTEEEKKYIPPDGGITIERTSPRKRILNSLFGRK